MMLLLFRDYSNVQEGSGAGCIITLLRSFINFMPKKLLYRLGEYRITDYENGRLSWERHVDFGVQRSGDGYLLGDVLILGPGSQEENGFLIGEFLDQLKKMPVWSKTRYYCHASELLEVATGRGLTEDFLNRVSSLEKKRSRRV